MVNRMILNKTSYMVEGAIENIVTEAKIQIREANIFGNICEDRDTLEDLMRKYF